MQYKTRQNFTQKLILSITILSIIGLVVVYFIVNTMFRSIIYDNVIGVTYSEGHSISQEIDYWFETSNHIVTNLSRLWVDLGADYIEVTANGFKEEYDFIAEIYVGFADDSIIIAGGWTPYDYWLPTTRPWYIYARANPGRIITTIPYVSVIPGHGIVTSVAKWLPDLDGMEAVVGIDITMDSIIDMINEYRIAANGYLILVSPGGEVIAHQRIRDTIGVDSIILLDDIPNGNMIMSHIRHGAYVVEFDDYELGPSYLMAFELPATGWNLVTVISAAAVSEPVSQNLLIIMLVSGAVIVTLLLLTMFFVTFLTKDMEESLVTKERLHAILRSSPLACSIIDETFNVQDVNNVAIKLFGLKDSSEYINRYFELSPEFQPDGRRSIEKMHEKHKECIDKGRSHFEWMHQTLYDKVQIPCEITFERLALEGKNVVIAYVRDLSDINNAATMVRQLERAAFTDALTGAKNRRYLLDEAENELQKSIRENFEYSLIMIDVDLFKRVNDTYGHPVGDEVLKILVRRISHALKHGTLVARYGGEEFIVTLPGSSPEGSVSTAERVRKTIEASKFVIGDFEIDVTVSLGVASKSEDAATLSEIISNADKALYQAKQTGRNKTVLWS